MHQTMEERKGDATAAAALALGGGGDGEREVGFDWKCHERRHDARECEWQ